LQLIKPFRGTVGLAAKNLKTNEQIYLNEKGKFPMQSVFKFPLALAVFDQIDKGKLDLNQKFNLKPSDLLPGTHSPLREKYPNGKKDISLYELLYNTVSLSDNNGCDFLFRLMGGCKKVNSYIQKHQKTGINIANNEAEMHQDSAYQYINYAKPEAMNALFEKFFEGKILSQKSKKELWKMLTETPTAPNRIRGKLPKNTVVGHKSGWSGGDDKGYTNAINDTGIIILPNGTAIAITIFIKDTYEKSAQSDELAAKISLRLYDHFNSGQ
jgi:beta-lactamase class A